MRNIILITILLLLSNSIFSQVGYKYGDEFISLESSGKAVFIQTKKNKAAIRQKELKLMKSMKSIGNFTQLNETRFVVFDKNYKPNIEDYISQIYETKNNDIVIVLPRIVLSLNDSTDLDILLKKYREQVSVEHKNDYFAILQCSTKYC